MCNKTILQKQNFTKEEADNYEDFLDLILNIILKYKGNLEEKNKK